MTCSEKAAAYLLEKLEESGALSQFFEDAECTKPLDKFDVGEAVLNLRYHLDQAKRESKNIRNAAGEHFSDPL